MALAMKHLIFFAIAILVVCQATEAKKLKQTQVEFYMHDTVGGPNPSAVRVAGRSNFTGSNPIAAMFGSIYMMDNPLTITPALNSTVMGRAQGIYEDGAIHVVQDGKPKVSDHVGSMTRGSTRPIDHKLRYGSEYAAKAYNSGSSSTRSHGHDHMLNEEYGRYICPTNESPSISYNKKGKGKWNMNLEMDNTLHKGVWRGDEKNDIIEEEEEEEEEEEIPKEDKMVLSPTTTQSSESSNDQSDESSSSFAFPVLCSEGMGSPVRMPKPDSLHFRKHHKTLAARLYCCRF
ncbi:Dirigent protein 15 [Camellia lanceoleosa]|uniref:Dirigent protein 15 n=1 Tax=Camellia lanceoleosa TaxID=1840588 RepID=A0ACC0FBP5_9ERIC|nr:Dirigent protein 15 [Camellia lanceoleosa]